MRRNRSPLFAILFVLLALVACGIVAYFALLQADQRTTSSAGSELLLTMLDVGQADSIFVKSPTGRTMLVDAGNARSDVDRVILPYLKKQGVTAIDYLVLTHPDQDHVGGMPALLDTIPVGAFVDSVQPGITNQAYRQTLQRVQDKGVKPIKARRGGAQIDLGDDTWVQILGPEDPLLTGGGSPTNNNAVVLRLTYGTVSALLAADIEQEGEERILGHREDLQSKLLKVAHHGSQGSTTDRFLDAVKPEVGLISAGAGNSYGHPHQALLERLQRHRVKVFRTDLAGTVGVAVDGRGYKVTTEK